MTQSDAMILHRLNRLFRGKNGLNVNIWDHPPPRSRLCCLRIFLLMKMYVIRSLESLAPSRRPSRRDRTPFRSIHTLAVGVRCEIFLCRLLLRLLPLHSLDDGTDLACSLPRGLRLRPTKAEEFCVFGHVHSYEYLHYTQFCPVSVEVGSGKLQSVLSRHSTATSRSQPLS